MQEQTQASQTSSARGTNQAASQAKHDTEAQAGADLHPERTTSSWREEPETFVGVTWMPATAHGEHSRDEKAMLPTTVFAFPKQRKLPLVDAEHVQTALDEFHQVEDVTDDERDQAFANLRAAAEHYELSLPVEDWRQLSHQ
jgi:hypothetical protein